jgi:DNA-binding transcriptional LysR family regulator
LRELRYFGVVAEELHFGRAAERLHISQPPLSQTIANLERKLGVRLLDRTSRRVRLTQAGAVLREHVRRILQDAEDAVAATRSATGGEAGTLRVTVGAVVRETMLPQLKHGLKGRFPELTLDITEELGNDVLARVLHGDADVGILVCPLATDGLESSALRRDRPVALVHASNDLAGRDSITIAELATHPLLVWPREQSAGAYDFVLSLFDKSPPASVAAIEMYDGGWWSEMVAGGFTVVPACVPRTPDYAAVPIEDADRDFVTMLLWSRRTPPHLLPALLDTLEELAVSQGWL